MPTCDRCYTDACFTIPNDDCTDYYTMVGDTGRNCELEEDEWAPTGRNCTAYAGVSSLAPTGSEQCDLPDPMGHGVNCLSGIPFGCNSVTCNDGYVDRIDFSNISDSEINDLEAGTLADEDAHNICCIGACFNFSSSSCTNSSFINLEQPCGDSAQQHGVCY